MEPMTLLNHEFFKQKNLVEVARIIATNYDSNWEALPFAQKYYRFAWQVLCKKVLWSWPFIFVRDELRW